MTFNELIQTKKAKLNLKNRDIATHLFPKNLPKAYSYLYRYNNVVSYARITPALKTLFQILEVTPEDIVQLDVTHSRQVAYLKLIQK